MAKASGSPAFSCSMRFDTAAEALVLAFLDRTTFAFGDRVQASDGGGGYGQADVFAFRITAASASTSPPSNNLRRMRLWP
jgi:hypothetical protein